MKSYNEILNEQEQHEEMLAENAAITAAIAASNAAGIASRSGIEGGGESTTEGLIFAGLFVFVVLGGFMAAVSHELGDWSFKGIKDYFKKIWLNHKLKPIIKKLSEDPEIVQASKEPTKGQWRKLISSKLSDKEQKYVYKIFRKHIKELKESLNEAQTKSKPSTPIREKRKSRLPNWRENGHLHMWEDSDGDMWIKHDVVDNNFVQLKELSDVNYSGSAWDGLNDVKLTQFYYAKKK
jgi:hypothetical protein